MMIADWKRRVGGFPLWVSLAGVGFSGFALFQRWIPFSEFLEKRLRLSNRPNGPYATTDLYLSALGIPQPSERVLGLISEIPESDGIVFIGSGDDPSFALSQYVFAYLGWPRKIGGIRSEERRVGYEGG